MKQAIFETQRRARWQQFEQWLKQPQQVDGSFDLAREYRFICQSLSLAQSRGYAPQLISYLNQLMQTGHQRIYQARNLPLLRILHFCSAGFAQLLRQRLGLLAISTLLFVGPALVAYLMILYNPQWAHELSSSAQLLELEQMYNPTSAAQARGADSDWQMFGYYIYNNISIAFQTYSSGLLFAVGSIYYLLVNGLHFGVAAGHLQQTGFEAQFFAFVCAHGAFELTAIVIAGAAGLELGLALISPGNQSRRIALIEAGRASIQLIYGCIAMLLVAALLEAFWSSSALPLAIKFSAGALCWLMVLSYFIFAGRRQ